MYGRKVVEIPQRHEPGLPVVYMSGHSNGLLGKTYVLDEDITFLEKPSTAGDLLHKLASAQRVSSIDRVDTTAASPCSLSRCVYRIA